MRLYKKIVIALAILWPVTVMAMDHTKPELSKDKFYKEYWEQHFLFDDGTFVTSQFLVANFPWPVGKDHGIMVSTVVSPDGKRVIIKNGRDLGKWGFDTDKLDIFIHTHRLRKNDDSYDILVGTDGRSRVDVTGTTDIAPYDHKKFENKKDFMESSFYLPYFEGEGKWNVRSDKKEPYSVGAEKAQGFGTHVKLSGRLNELLKNWLRVSGLRGTESQPQPFLSSIERTDGSKDIVLTLKNPNGTIVHFSDVKIDYKEIKQGDKKSSYPTVIELTARNGSDNLSGTIKFTRKIDHFNINNHLNFFERSFANSRASVANYRYVADYNLTYSIGGEIQKLSGKALSEYQDILPPKKKKKKKKRRR